MIQAETRIIATAVKKSEARHRTHAGDIDDFNANRVASPNGTHVANNPVSGTAQLIISHDNMKTRSVSEGTSEFSHCKSNNQEGGRVLSQ